MMMILLVLVSSRPLAAFARQNPGPGTMQDQTAAAWLAEIADVRQKAEQGDTRAQYTLGHDYLVGAGVPQDQKIAAKWYAAAAAHGSAEAQFALGYLYEQGEGVGKDYRQAATYYRAAAERAHAAAR
jgi:TPR repeat protein